jgi:hypothetical protein
VLHSGDDVPIQVGRERRRRVAEPFGDDLEGDPRRQQHHVAGVPQPVDGHPRHPLTLSPEQRAVPSLINAHVSRWPGGGRGRAVPYSPAARRAPVEVKRTDRGFGIGGPPHCTTVGTTRDRCGKVGCVRWSGAAGDETPVCRHPHSWYCHLDRCRLPATVASKLLSPTVSVNVTSASGNVICFSLAVTRTSPVRMLIDTMDRDVTPMQRLPASRVLWSTMTPSSAETTTWLQAPSGTSTTPPM